LKVRATAVHRPARTSGVFEHRVHLVDLGLLAVDDPLGERDDVGVRASCSSGRPRALGVVDLLGECDHDRVGAVGDRHLGHLDGLFVLRDHSLNRRDVGSVDVVGQVS
jgi:hypothetical protein